MAGSGAIYRKTALIDTEAGLGASEKIEFNSGAVPDATGRIIATSFRAPRDINIHPNPRRAGDQIQDGLLGVLEVTVTGYFVDHDATLAPANLYNWQIGTSTNAAMPFGRFGLRLDDFAGGILDLDPTATLGYILHDVEVHDNERPRDEVGFIARFYLNGTPVTV